MTALYTATFLFLNLKMEFEGKRNMKYKVLLTGKNNAVIDDFFTHAEEEFEIEFCSCYRDDLVSHFKCYRPDILVYCICNETKESYSNIISTKPEITPLVIVGEAADCNIFDETGFYTADLVLRKPITIKAIQESIMDFLKEKERAREEERRKQQEKEEAERKKHILIVDDDPIVLRMLKEQLHTKYEVATAIGGKIALSFLERKTTDLILLDYEMPSETGPEVLQKIRANEKNADIPVVFLTGVTEKQKIQKALVMKPQGYLLKPIDKGKLFSLIDSLINVSV